MLLHTSSNNPHYLLLPVSATAAPIREALDHYCLQIPGGDVLTSCSISSFSSVQTPRIFLVLKPQLRVRRMLQRLSLSGNERDASPLSYGASPASTASQHRVRNMCLICLLSIIHYYRRKPLLRSVWVLCGMDKELTHTVLQPQGLKETVFRLRGMLADCAFAAEFLDQARVLFLLSLCVDQCCPYSVKAFLLNI